TEAASAIDPRVAQQMRRELVDWAKGELTAQGAALEAEPARDAGGSLGQQVADGAPLELRALDRRWSPVAAESAADEEPREFEASLRTSHSFDLSSPHRAIDLPRRPSVALQLHDRYLVTESDDGMVVIDQHALHERILYEQLREKVLSGAVESQALLV